MVRSFEVRRAEAVRILAKNGVPRWKSIPATYRFAWSRGMKLRPPHFSSWETNFAFFGGAAGGFAGIGSWLAIVAVGGEMPPLRAVVTGLIFVVIFGFSEAARHKREAEDHSLPTWDDLPDVADVLD